MRSNCRLFAFGLPLLAACYSVVAAQQPPLPQAPPSQLLASFRGSGGSHGSTIYGILLHPDSYNPGWLDQLLSGLTALALNADSPHLRAASVSALSLPGERQRSRPVTGVVTRLVQVYRQSSDPDVRGVVVAVMSDQAERPEALAFLGAIATQPSRAADFPNSASAAIHSLTMMEADGAAVLKRLHETGAVKDQRAREDLDLIAQRGYRTD